MNDIPSPASFLNHRKAEFTLVADLERLRAFAARLGLADLAVWIEDTRSRIAAHRFSIAVVGEFKRGKSTFINALLGKEILPSDIAPTSATINWVTYGLKPAVKIRLRGTAEEHFIDIAQLVEYVTKLTPESKARASTIEEATVYYPAQLCKNNVDVVDTPGLSDDAAMTAVTLGILPRVDAAILVILATAPFSQSEADFLERLLMEYSLGSVLFVVTAIDRLNRPSDRETIVTTVAERIRESIQRQAVKRFGEGTQECQDYLGRVGEPRVFGVSGYDGLRGKLEGDEALLQRSLLPEFETFLERFLTEESGLVALRSHTERILSFVAMLRRELTSRIGSPELMPHGLINESYDALLRSVEWIGADAKNYLQDQRRETQAHIRALLQDFPRSLRQAAEQNLNFLNATADDLEPERLPAYLQGCCTNLTEALNSTAREGAERVVTELRSRLQGAVSDLLRFALVFDRVMLHVRSEALSADAGSFVHVPRSMTGKLGASEGFERSNASEVASRVVFDPYVRDRRAGFASRLGVPVGWADGLDVQPMASVNFGKALVNVIRVEKFKIDLRQKLLDTLASQLQSDSAGREQGSDQQVEEAFAVLVRHIDEALEEIRAQFSRLETRRHRRIAAYEHERRSLEQMDADIQAIEERAREGTRQLNQFRGAAKFHTAPS